MATITLRSTKGSPLTNNEVDANFTNLNTDKAELSGATFTGEITANGGIALGDNDKATFGASDDLQIYHTATGNHSIIEETGGGSLVVRTNGPHIEFDKGSTEYMARMLVDGAVELYYDSALKLATTSTGIDVTGSVVADKANIGTSTAQYSGTDLTVGDNADSQNGLAIQTSTSGVGYILFGDGSGASAYRGEINYVHSTDSMTLKTAGTSRLNLASNGDISFYEDTGTTPKLFWDASAESLGIGISSPDTQLTLYKASTNADVDYAKMRMDSWGGSTGKLKSIVWDDAGSSVAGIGAEYDGAKTNIHFHSQYNGGFKGTSDRTMSIMGNGNVGIGVVPETDWNAGYHALQLGETATFMGTASGDGNWLSNNAIFSSSGSWEYIQTAAASSLDMQSGTAPFRFRYAASGTAGAAISWSEAMRIDSSGRVGIGTSSVAGYSNGSLQVHATSGLGAGLWLTESASGSGVSDGLRIVQYNNNSTLYNGESGYMSFGTNNAERLRIDSSGNLLVGNTDPTPYDRTSGNAIALGDGLISSAQSGGNAAIFNRMTNDGSIVGFRKNGSPVGSIGVNTSGLYIADAGVGFRFDSGGTDDIIPCNATGAAADASINLGSSGARFKDLYLSGTSYVGSEVVLADSGTAKFAIGNSGNDFYIYSNAAGSERMRIDSSGNLLVGKTSAATNVEGGELRENGQVIAVATNVNPFFGARLGSDGDLAVFRKDNTTVGSIGVLNSNNLTITGSAADHGGLQFATHSIVPMEAGVDSNGTIDLGSSASRFKDLYLSGHVITGGGGTNNTGEIEFVADSTRARIVGGYQGGGGGYLKFHTDTTGGSDLERMRIDSSGNLLVGTTTLADVNNIITNHLFEGGNSTAGNAAVGVYNNTGTANCPAFNVLNRDESTDTTNRFVQFYANVTSTGATAMGGIVGNGASNVQFAALSDVREKENIETITGSLDKIISLNPVEFDWIASGEHCKAGFVAQEVEEVFPEFVVENMASEGQEERKGLTGGMTGGIVTHLVKAIQEQQTLIESLTDRIAALEE